MIDAGQPLPPRYKPVLFAQPHEAELIWPGKTAEVTNVVLPFQSIEQIDEPRAETSGQVADLFAFDAATGRQSSGWTNKLIWGDNKLVLAWYAPGRAHRRAPSVRRPRRSRNPVQRAAFRCGRTPAFPSPFLHLRGLGHITSPRPGVPRRSCRPKPPILATIFRMASIAANWKISRRCTLPIGDPASRLAYHPLRRAPRPAFDRVIFTAVTAVEWQA